MVRILSKWIQHFWIDFVNNEDLLSDLKNFVGNVLQPADKRMKTALIALVKKKVKLEAAT